MQSLNTLTREQLVEKVETLQKRVDEYKQLDAMSGQTQERLNLFVQLLVLIIREEEPRDVIRKILLQIQESTGFEAVGIRWKKGEDFPYYETSGFPATTSSLRSARKSYSLTTGTTCTSASATTIRTPPP